MPLELSEYIYREKFGLSAEEFEMEPADKFFINCQIRAWIGDKARLDQQHE